MAKSDLIFAKPIMNAAGSLGFAPDPRAAVPWEAFGAFITNPISLRPRAVTQQPAVLEYPGGCLLHTGLPNPGFRSAMTRYAHRWSEAVLPIIVHLMADRPEQASEMTRQLEGLDNILAVELGFAPLLADDIILLAVEMCAGELPVIACLPRDQVLRVGPRVIESGASAVSLAPPRGTLARGARTIAGRLYGPSLLPMSLEAVRTAAQIDLPLIAAGGISSTHDAQALLAAGAIAVQMDTALWLPDAETKGLVN